MLALGVGQTPATLVCANPVGGPPDPDAFTKAARRFARQAGVTGARLHDSRHGYGIQLLAQCVHPGIASAVLGHADPGFDADPSARPRRDGPGRRRGIERAALDRKMDT